MPELKTQVQELAPSAKEPLFRRLMVTENLSYLREKNSIVGFEVDMNTDQVLSGFTLIAIQKHTIYAYCSDRGERLKLVLFPPIDKLFDPEFELLDLVVTKRRYTNASFIGADLGHGKMEALVKDLTPPEKKVDIPEMVAAQMVGRIRNMQDAPPVELKKEPEPEMPVQEPEPANLNAGFEDEYNYDGFEDSWDGGYADYGGDYGSYEPEPPEPEPDERSTMLLAQSASFCKLSDVSEYCTMTLGVPKPLAVTLVNKALQSEVSPEYRIPLVVKLFCKLFDEKKI